jgi:serine/threonine protein kinase
MSTLDRKELEMKCGTPMYISPERLGKQKYSTNADLFSVGVIMHELLSPNSYSRLPLKWQKPTQTTLLNYDWAARTSEISK